MIFILLLTCIQLPEPRLMDLLGRNEWEIYSEPYPITSGASISKMELPSRLKKRGYTRVHNKPSRPGTFFWGNQHFWIYRPSGPLHGEWNEKALICLKLNKNGTVSGRVGSEGLVEELTAEHPLLLEPIPLWESLDEDRFPRIVIPFKQIPEKLWRALLAAEDSRFFEHPGIDSKAIARSLLKNVKAKKIVMGGSTLTQQLIKNRDLTPIRSLRRKASEAVRALILETEFDKEEILEAYMNHVYLGHLHGRSVYGFPAAAKQYLSKNLNQLTLGECALLAGMVQGPNLFQPQRHPEKCRTRRNWVLGRMLKLNWISEEQFKAAKSEAIHSELQYWPSNRPTHFLNWVKLYLSQEKPRYFKKGRGAKVVTTLDPIVQNIAQESLESGLKKLHGTKAIRRLPSLEGALVCMDLSTGGVLAYVSGSTDTNKKAFDRVRLAKRQPGSTIKPFILLSAFNSFRHALYPGTLVKDTPFSLKTGPNTWVPENYDHRFHGIVSLRDSLVNSYNIPFVKVGLHIGLDQLGQDLNRWGLDTPKPPPPSVSLGAIEMTPLQLLEAYSIFFLNGKNRNPRPVIMYDKPDGKKGKTWKPDLKKQAKSGSAYLVYDLLREAMKRGTATAGQPGHYNCAGKTGTSSDYRDAWFVGGGESLLTLVWVGCDNNDSINLPASQTAARIWRDFMTQAIPLRPGFTVKKPGSIKSCRIDPGTGLRIFGLFSGYKEEIYRRGAAPRRERPWRTNDMDLIE